MPVRGSVPPIVMLLAVTPGVPFGVIDALAAPAPRPETTSPRPSAATAAGVRIRLKRVDSMLFSHSSIDDPPRGTPGHYPALSSRSVRLLASRREMTNCVVPAMPRGATSTVMMRTAPKIMLFICEPRLDDDVRPRPLTSELIQVIE